MTAPALPTHAASEDERLRRWRLILGGEQADGTGCKLSGH